MRIINLLFFVFISLSIKSIDCRSFHNNIGEQRKENYALSNTVLLGVITEINENIVTVRVSEIFKGVADKVSIVKFENNINLQDVYSLWLIYGNKLSENDTIFVSRCSNSRSINSTYLPSPPIKNSKIKARNKVSNEKLDNELFEINYRLLFLEEIEVLRTLKH
jgi:hypothetical protein